MAYIRKAEFEIVGAGCVTCVRQIERMLKNTTGVESARIEGVVPPRATVIYDMDKTNLKVFTDQIKKAGYAVKNERDSFYRMSERAKEKADDAATSLLKMPELRSPHL
jgi:copper chaperone CopZ